MKTSLLTVLLLSTFAWASVPTRESINTLVENIKPPRVGLSQKTLSVLKNPFIYKRKASKNGKTTTQSSRRFKANVYKSSSHSYTKRVRSFKLYATLNKSAKINNRWINLNKKIGSYTLKTITKNYVTLQKGTAKPITVYLNSKNKNINLLTK